MRSYFCVNVHKYVQDKHFDVVRPASLEHPKNNAVMFLSSRYAEQASEMASVFESVRDCLIFWPDNAPVPENIAKIHAVVKCTNPHNRLSGFYTENGITYLPEPCECRLVNGAWIEVGANIAPNCVIFPGAYIGKNVSIGEDCYIGSGVKIVGEVIIGNHVIIRENTIIGADGLTTDRDENGKALSMPQFGGVQIGNNVTIGANTVIARGAVDDTTISDGVKIDNSVFISHNVFVGEDTFIVGETIMFGGASTGERVMISGNSLIANRVHIGDHTLLGASSTATKSIPNDKVAYGSPAKVVRDR